MYGEGGGIELLFDRNFVFDLVKFWFGLFLKRKGSLLIVL